MQNKLRNAASAIILVAGVLLLFYPMLSSWVNKTHSVFVSEEYDQAVEEMTEDKRQRILTEARAYNERLYTSPYSMTAEEYEALLNPLGNGVMGTLKIPRLDVSLPIYHGSTESVLQSGIGHLENTSLPVGGVNTHAALSGHRGLPSKQLLTDLDQLRLGDVFYLNIIGDTLAYRVDQIKTVLPSEVSDLQIVEGGDYVTLITCTPYGVNSHRLLVRGTRIPYEEAATDEVSGGFVLTQLQKEMLIALVVLLIFFFSRFCFRKRKKRQQEKSSQE